MEAIYDPSFSPLEGKRATSYRGKHIYILLFFFRTRGANYICILAVERIKNKKAATDRIHKLFEEPMSSFFSQASPPPPSLSTPPPSPPPKRKRDQLLSPGGK